MPDRRRARARESSQVGTSQTTRKATSAIPEAPWINSVSASTTQQDEAEARATRPSARRRRRRGPRSSTTARLVHCGSPANARRRSPCVRASQRDSRALGELLDRQPAADEVLAQRGGGAFAFVVAGRSRETSVAPAGIARSAERRIAGGLGPGPRASAQLRRRSEPSPGTAAPGHVVRLLRGRAGAAGGGGARAGLAPGRGGGG